MSDYGVELTPGQVVRLRNLTTHNVGEVEGRRVVSRVDFKAPDNMVFVLLLLGAEREDGSVPLEWQDNLRRAMLTDREADAELAELVGEIVGLIEEAREKICADWEADDLLRHALSRAKEWQKGGDDGDD